jgi:hypothetical protein
MSNAKAQQTRRREREKDSPEMLISFLQYALEDVRALSARGGRHLDQAIAALSEDTSAVDVSRVGGDLRQRN